MLTTGQIKGALSSLVLLQSFPGAQLKLIGKGAENRKLTGQVLSPGLSDLRLALCGTPKTDRILLGRE